MNDLGQKLTEMAESLIEEVRESSLDTKIDAFKAVSTFYTATARLGKKAVPEEDDGGISMKALRDRVQRASSGNVQ